MQHLSSGWRSQSLRYRLISAPVCEIVLSLQHSVEVFSKSIWKCIQKKCLSSVRWVLGWVSNEYLGWAIWYKCPNLKNCPIQHRNSFNVPRVPALVVMRVPLLKWLLNRTFFLAALLAVLFFGWVGWKDKRCEIVLSLQHSVELRFIEVDHHLLRITLSFPIASCIHHTTDEVCAQVRRQWVASMGRKKINLPGNTKKWFLKERKKKNGCSAKHLMAHFNLTADTAAYFNFRWKEGRMNSMKTRFERLDLSWTSSRKS